MANRDVRGGLLVLGEARIDSVKKDPRKAGLFWCCVKCPCVLLFGYRLAYTHFGITNMASSYFHNTTS
jgi:hypothetical protein